MFFRVQHSLAEKVNEIGISPIREMGEGEWINIGES